MPVTGILMTRISPARSAAFQTLIAVEKGAFASDLLRELSHTLDTRDARLAAQIVYGCLRFRAQLDFLISRVSRRPAEQLDLPVRLALRMAIFQLRYLERIPSHAAVHEAVELVKEQKRPAAGLTNAVLRKVNRKPVAWPDSEIRLSCPAWLMARWADHFGADSATKIAAAALQEPAAYIRVAPGHAPPDRLEVRETEIPGCFQLLSPAPEGTRLHDISSQAIIPLLDLQPGQSYLDLCAAPGNKTLQAIETPLGLAIACDISLKRLGAVPGVCPRVVLDGAKPLPFRKSFERIFIDAPCSGTGTLARNPEIKWRLRETDFARFQERQIAILSEGLRFLRPDGKLVYATCSLEREENEDVIQSILQAHSNLRCLREVWRIPGRDEGDGFYAATLVWKRAVT